MESTPTAPTEVHPALATVAGDQCSSCGAPLAADQRYCVQCGQRRGQPNLPVATSTPAAAPARAPRAPRFGASTALIAGVGTLLLAMGVGVLIGRTNHQAAGARAAAPVQVVTVGGGGGGGTAATAATTGKSAKNVKPRRTGRSAGSADVAKAARKIKGTTLKLPKKAVVKVGTPGTGPGYQGGKFTGNFFGG